MIQSVSAGTYLGTMRTRPVTSSRVSGSIKPTPSSLRFPASFHISISATCSSLRHRILARNFWLYEKLYDRLQKSGKAQSGFSVHHSRRSQTETRVTFWERLSFRYGWTHVSKVILNNVGSVCQKIRSFPKLKDKQWMENLEQKFLISNSRLSMTGIRVAYLKNSLSSPVVIRLISKIGD